MPRDRIDFFRESNTLEKEKILVLAFEGNIAEEEYFEEIKSIDSFNDELIYLHLLKRPKRDTNSAPKHVFNKLRKEARDEYNFGKDDELWMIIDTDDWQNIPDIIELCSEQGNMFVAVSNPSFEFWLLLHICKYESISDEDKDRLRKNEKSSTRKRFVDEFLGERIDGGYNKRNPRIKRFMEFVQKAIKEAKGLEKKGKAIH
ncbi:MAG: RloB family protein [Saprospiraceae bacterium]